MSNVCGSAPTYRPMKPTNRASEPRKVYRKNVNADRGAFP
jgi:hypothetical protein